MVAQEVSRRHRHGSLSLDDLEDARGRSDLVQELLEDVRAQYALVSSTVQMFGKRFVCFYFILSRDLYFVIGNWPVQRPI